MVVNMMPIIPPMWDHQCCICVRVRLLQFLIAPTPSPHQKFSRSWGCRAQYNKKEIQRNCNRSTSHIVEEWKKQCPLENVHCQLPAVKKQRPRQIQTKMKNFSPTNNGSKFTNWKIVNSFNDHLSGVKKCKIILISQTILAWRENCKPSAIPENQI